MKLNPLWDLSFACVLTLLICWYFAEKPSERGISRIRQFFFYLAMFLAFVVLVGPIPHLAVKTFSIHMVQHVALMMLISPLIVLGSPIRIAHDSRFPIVRRVVRGTGQNLVIRQLFRPEVGFAIFLATLISTHFSPLADAGMRNPNVHVLELIMFLVGGFIYYYPVLEGNPKPFMVAYPVRVLSLFAMMLPETMTGFFLYSGNKLLHAVPMDMSNMNGLSDQHTGGAIMWAMGMLIDATWIGSAAYDWFANEKALSEVGEASD